MKSFCQPKPEKILNCTQLARKYGFNEHYQFIDFIYGQFPECFEELKAAGYRQNEVRFYRPSWQKIIEKHLGSPIYRKITAAELARLYGYKQYNRFAIHLCKTPGLMGALKEKGWEDYYHRKFISLWLVIIFEYLGVPEGVEEIMQGDLA